MADSSDDPTKLGEYRIMHDGRVYWVEVSELIPQFEGPSVLAWKPVRHWWGGRKTFREGYQAALEVLEVKQRRRAKAQQAEGPRVVGRGSL